MSVLDNGEPLDATATLLRNLVRPIDILMGYPLLALSRKKQRLGDMIADTLVIKHRQKRKGGLALGILAVLLLGMGYLTYQNSNRFWFSSKLNFKLPALQPSLHKTTTPSPTPSTPNRNVRENEKITEIKIPPTAPATQLPKPQSTSSLLKVTQFAFSGPELIPMGNNPVFNRGDLMFVFFTLEGFQKEENGQANIVEDIQLIGPDGELVAAQSNVADFNEVVPQGSPSLQFANQLKLSNTLSTGTYNFILIAKDNLNGGQLVYEKQFRVR